MWRLVALVGLLSLTSSAWAQISTDDAQKRLAEKQAARNADRSTPITISKGELDDLRAEVARLHAEVLRLTALAKAPPPSKAPPTATTMPAANTDRQIKLTDVPEKVDTRSAVGARLYGEGDILEVSPKGAGKFEVGIASSEKTFAHKTQLTSGEMVLIEAVAVCDEETALHLSKDDRVIIAGTVESIENIPPTRDKVGVIKIHLVKARLTRR